MRERQATEPPSAGSWGAFLRDPATCAVGALGCTQIIAWGTTFYVLGVLGRPIAADTGWSQSLVFGGFTIALLVSSAVSTLVGRLIDRRGGRAVMALGSLLTALGLALLSLVAHPYAYLSAWAFLGLAMRMALYDAAFAALVQVTPWRGRRAISYLTLFGGLASTVRPRARHPLWLARDAADIRRREPVGLCAAALGGPGPARGGGARVSGPCA